MTDIQTDFIPAETQDRSSLATFARVSLILALLMVAGVALSFLLIALPANDDFIRATQASKPHLLDHAPNFLQRWVGGRSGYWNYCWYLYFNWQGRWVSYGLESAVLPRWDMTRIYPALIGSVAVVNVLGLFAVCRCFTRSASRWFSLGCTLGLAAVLWAQMPSLAQTVYWFVGGVENLMPLALAGVLLVGLVSLRANVAWVIVASLLAIVTTGLHEAYGAMLWIGLTGGTVAAFWMRSRNRDAWLVVLIVASVGLSVVVFAPGNWYRMKIDGPKQAPRAQVPTTVAPIAPSGAKPQRQLKAVLQLTAKQLWNDIRAWVFDPKLLAAALFVAFSPALEAGRPVWVTQQRIPWRWLIPVIWFAMLFVGFFMPSYAFVDVMPPRTLSANFVVFAVGWLVMVFIFTRNLHARDSVGNGVPGLRSRGAASIAMLLLATSVVFTGNTIDGAHDLCTRQVLHWRASAEQRYALLRRPGPDDQIIPRLATCSRLLYSGEIWIDPKNWTNFSLADYFHRKSLRVLPIAGNNATTLPAVNADNDAPNM
jgi:hypothetical protein